MRNLEFKARVDDPRRVLPAARRLGADLYGDLRQTDTYFRVRRGRLKLREMPGLQAELIFYEREEESDGRLSDYDLVHSKDPEALRRLLGRPLV